MLLQSVSGRELECCGVFQTTLRFLNVLCARDRVWLSQQPTQHLGCTARRLRTDCSAHQLNSLLVTRFEIWICGYDPRVAVCHNAVDFTHLNIYAASQLFSNESITIHFSAVGTFHHRNYWINLNLILEICTIVLWALSVHYIPNIQFRIC
jgi:hypothetical protein